MAKRPKNIDLNQLAKFIVDESLDDIKNEDDEAATDVVAAIKPDLKYTGSKGGNARSKKLTSEEKIDIARLAANARWKKTPK